MTLPKSKIFLLFCLSFIVGVGLGRFLNYYAMAIAAVVFVILVTIFGPSTSSRTKKAMLIGFLGLTLLAGAFRYKTSFPYDKPNFIGTYYGQEVELEGIIVKDPDVRSDRVNLTVRPLPQSLPPPKAGRGMPGEGRAVGNVLLNVGRYPEYRYGDKLKIKGLLEEPFESEEFSYKNYLSRFDTYALMRYPEIEKLDSRQGNPVKRALLSVKHKFQEVLSKSLPEPHNALILGLILGLKRSLPQELKDALIIAGVSHIVVISGYNISIITRNLLRTRIFLGRKVALILSLLAVAAFVVITGAEASVIRAALMGILLVFALNVGRIYQAANALIFVAALMVLQNPKILSFDIGFQLSFAATLGLIYLAPVFDKWLRKIPNFFFLQFRTNLASTLAAIIFTLPLLVFYFDRISLIAPLANVLILWTIPYSMFFGFFVGLLGILYLPLAQFLANISWVLLEYLIRVVEFFSRIPFAERSVEINLFAVVAYYLLLVYLLGFYRRRNKFYHQLEYVEAKV